MIFAVLLLLAGCYFCYKQGIKDGNENTIKIFREKAESLSKQAREDYYKMEKELNG